MAFYKDPEDMYRKRAERFRKEGARHYAQAKQGEGDFHFGKAKAAYKRFEECLAQAEKCKGMTWKKNLG